LSFGGKGFIQQVVITWEGGDNYAEQIVDRILNSLDVKTQAEMFENIEFANPEFFWLLLLLPLALLWYFFKRKKETASLRISSIKGFTTSSWAAKARPMLFILRLLALASIVTAVA